MHLVGCKGLCMFSAASAISGVPLYGDLAL